MRFYDSPLVEEFIDKLNLSKTMKRGQLDQNLWWKNITIELDKLRLEDANCVEEVA